MRSRTLVLNKDTLQRRIINKLTNFLTNHNLTLMIKVDSWLIKLVYSGPVMFWAESNSSCLGKDHFTSRLAAAPWESSSCAMKRCWVAKPLWKEEHGYTYNRIIYILLLMKSIVDTLIQIKTVSFLKISLRNWTNWRQLFMRLSSYWWQIAT